MKPILVILSVATSLFVSACDTMKPAAKTGPTTGVKSQSGHSGNTQGQQATQ
jgi:hypothetical protein